MILHTDGMTQAQEDQAKDILNDLSTIYPGHPWSVRVAGGVVFIRHLTFGKNWGMNLKFNEVNHDAAVLKRKIMLLAGEWLERAGLRRGRSEDVESYKVEGVPDKDQMPQFKAPVATENTIVKQVGDANGNRLP